MHRINVTTRFVLVVTMLLVLLIATVVLVAQHLPQESALSHQQVPRQAVSWPCSDAKSETTPQPFNFRVCQVGILPFSHTYEEAEIELTMFQDTPLLSSIEFNDETRNLKIHIQTASEAGTQKRAKDDKTTFKLTEIFGSAAAPTGAELKMSVTVTSLAGKAASISGLFIKLKKQ